MTSAAGATGPSGEQAAESLADTVDFLLLLFNSIRAGYTQKKTHVVVSESFFSPAGWKQPIGNSHSGESLSLTHLT